MTDGAGSRIRVSIQQSVIPLYAVPLFEGIARDPRLALSVTYSTEGHALKNHVPRGVEVLDFPVRGPGVGPLAVCWHVAQWQLAARGATEVLVLEWNVRFHSLLPAILRARINGIPTLLWGHGYSKRPSRLRDLLRRMPAWLADGLILYDSQTASRYRRGMLTGRIVHHAANSLDDQAIAAVQLPWRRDPARLQAFRETHGLTRGKTLLFIGRLYRDNDLSFLLQAVARVMAREPACRLIVIGDDPEELPTLKRQAVSLGIEATTLWTGALYEEAQIAPWALCADVFVYPRNIGLSLLHAFNYSLPVVTGGDRALHNPEIHALTDGHNGLFIPGDDPADYADAVLRLLEQPALLAHLSAGADETIASEYNMRNMVAQFVAAILSVR